MKTLINRRYAKNLTEAKQIFKSKTGVVYNKSERHHSGLRIFTLKNKTKTRTHFIGTYIEWLNK